jgi:hypothetical protein
MQSHKTLCLRSEMSLLKMSLIPFAKPQSCPLPKDTKGLSPEADLPSFHGMILQDLQTMTRTAN